MGTFNLITTFIFDLFFRPFESLSPWCGLIALSIASGIVLIVIFKFTSKQAAIRAVKDRIRGGFLEIRLYQDDFGVMMKALGRIFISNIIYLRYSLVPLVFMMAPVLVLLVQANARYGVRPALPGEQVMVTLRLRDPNSTNLNGIRMELPKGVVTTVPAVRIPADGEIAWAVKAEKPGTYTIGFRAGNDVIEHVFVCGTGAPGVTSRRAGAGAWDMFLNPGLRPIKKDSIIESMTIDYPHRLFSVAGINVHWLIIYFIVSIIFGFSIKGALGIEI